MGEMRVVGIRVEAPQNQPVLLLREAEGARYLAIWIGQSEAASIALQQRGIEPPRPLTHDLMATVIHTLGHTLDEVRITEMNDGVFYAVLLLDGHVEISARPSDAIALALRTATPILATELVLDEAGVTMAIEDEDEVERFRKFLDQVSPEDFEERRSE